MDSTIRNIHVSGLRRGCKAFAVNMDAARYCLTPLVSPESARFKESVGDVRDVTIEDAFVYPTRPNKSLICLEGNMENFTVRNFRIDRAHGCVPSSPSLNTSYANQE